MFWLLTFTKSLCLPLLRPAENITMLWFYGNGLSKEIPFVALADMQQDLGRIKQCFHQIKSASSKGNQIQEKQKFSPHVLCHPKFA